jgi:hypothetical protein
MPTPIANRLSIKVDWERTCRREGDDWEARIAILVQNEEEVIYAYLSLANTSQLLTLIYDESITCFLIGIVLLWVEKNNRGLKTMGLEILQNGRSLTFLPFFPFPPLHFWHLSILVAGRLALERSVR